MKFISKRVAMVIGRVKENPLIPFNPSNPFNILLNSNESRIFKNYGWVIYFVIHFPILY